MERLTIPGIGRETSRVALGTWAIGGWLWGGPDDTNALATIRRAIDMGINVIDTAPIYGFGHAETLVGQAVAASGQRDRLVIATKFGLEWNRGKVFRNSRRERILKEIDDSLSRLQTDYIDIYQVHWPDTHVPFEETADVLHTLREKGKIRAIGVSNYSPGQMDAFRRAAPLHTAQPPYNLFERQIEDDILPYCRQEDIVMLTYGALCRGLLSGKMTPDTEFSGDDLRRRMDPKFQPPRYAQYLAAVDRLQAFAREHYERDVIHLAVRWLLDQAPTIVALWGARRPDQLKAIERVWDWHLDNDARRAITTIIEETVTDPVGPEFMAPPA